MNRFEEKQADRKARLEAAADRADDRASEAFGKADLREEKSGIPLGQPILVGHHSEKRHRAAIDRSDKAMRRGVEEGKRADQLRNQAASVGTGGISSDDPEALVKLKAKLAAHEEAQANMKAANKIVRNWSKKGLTPESTGEDFDAYAAELAELKPSFFTVEQARDLLAPQFGAAGPIGYPPYALTNNNATIKATKKRIATLEVASTAQTKRHTYQGVCDVVENTEENRLQFIFDGKPSAEVRGIMKSHSFRWAPSQGAWQRKLTGNARYSARLALKALGVEI